MNYEGDREHNGGVFQATVPTLALAQGIFANPPAGLGSTLKVQPVDPTNGVPFPGGNIPMNRWSPVAARILAYPQFPVPNALPLVTTPGAYTNTVINTVRSDKFDIRADHNLTATSRLFGRYSFLDSTTFRPAPFKGYAEGSNNDQFGNTLTRGQSAVAGDTTILTPTTTLDLRLGYTRLGANVFPPNFGSASSTTLLGIPNLPQGPTINAGWPKFNISGLSAFGSTTSQPQYQIPNTYLASGVISMQRGAHNIRLGSDVTYIQTAILDVSALRGTFNFSNTWTGNPFGDFLLGLPSSYTQTSPTVAYNRNWIYNFFIQDDYHILPNLTLNLGLRYEYGTPIYEKYNHLSNYELATRTLVLASSSDRSLVNPDLRDFAPRIGLAWTAMPKLVVRSAYGMFYQHTFRQGRENLLAENPPFLHDLTRSQGPGAAPFVTLNARPSGELLRHCLAYRPGSARQRAEPESGQRAAVELDAPICLRQRLGVRSWLRWQQGHPPFPFLERQSAERCGDIRHSCGATAKRWIWRRRVYGLGRQQFLQRAPDASRKAILQWIDTAAFLHLCPRPG